MPTVTFLLCFPMSKFRLAGNPPGNRRPPHSADATKQIVWFPPADPATLRDRCSSQTQQWYSGTSFDKNEEDDLRTGIVLAIGGLAFLAGCSNQGNKASSVPIEPKWKGPAYRLAFDTQAAKPNPVGVTIPAIKYTADPDGLEKRAILVVRFDASAVTKNGPIMNQMIMAD